MEAAMVAQFRDTDIGQARWVNNERLLFSTVDRTQGRRDVRFAPGVFAVNRDGKQFRQLAKRNEQFIRAGGDRDDMLPWHTGIMQSLPTPTSPMSTTLPVLTGCCGKGAMPRSTWRA